MVMDVAAEDEVGPEGRSGFVDRRSEADEWT